MTFHVGVSHAVRSRSFSQHCGATGGRRVSISRAWTCRFYALFHSSDSSGRNFARFASLDSPSMVGGPGIWKSVPSSSRIKNLFDRSAAANAAAMPI